MHDGTGGFLCACLPSCQGSTCDTGKPLFAVMAVAWKKVHKTAGLVPVA